MIQDVLSRAIDRTKTAWEKEKEVSETRGKPTCFILAKKNSQRLPHKNMLTINGKPLILHAIDCALESKIFDKIIVSTDCPKMLEMAYDRRLEIQGKSDTELLLNNRPVNLVSKETQMKHVVKFLVDTYKPGDIICVLTPCNPTRTPEDLKAGLDLLWAKGANYVVSVKSFRPSVECALNIKGKYLQPVFGHDNLKQAQKLPKHLIPDGVFIWAKTEAFLSEWQKGFIGTKCLPYFTPHVSIDIDIRDDYLYSCWLLENK